MTKPLYFVAFKGTSWTSRLQRFFTRSDYSHIAYLPVRFQSDLIEAWHIDGKLRWGFSCFANHTSGTPYEVWCLEVPDEIHRDVNDDHLFIARNQIGYDYWGVASFVLKITKDDPRKLFCSEGCIRKLAELKRWNKIRPEHVSPEDFVRIIQAAGGLIVETGKA